MFVLGVFSHINRNFGDWRCSSQANASFSGRWFSLKCECQAYSIESKDVHYSSILHQHSRAGIVPVRARNLVGAVAQGAPVSSAQKSHSSPPTHPQPVACADSAAVRKTRYE